MGRQAGDAQNFPLGSTWYGGDASLIPPATAYGNEDIEGSSRTFRREEYPNLSAAIPGGGDLVAKCVRNVHSTVLAKSTIVKYNPLATNGADEGFDRRVVPCGAGESAAGIVDPWLYQDVVVGDLFWIIQAGIVPVLFGATITGTAAGVPIATAAAGVAVPDAAQSNLLPIIGIQSQTADIVTASLGNVLLDIRFG